MIHLYLVIHNQIPLKEISELPSEFQIKYVYLYNNSWECDCNMATQVRVIYNSKLYNKKTGS